MTGPLLAAATDRLRAAGVASPRVDAELLLAHVLGVPRTRVVLAAAPPLDTVARYEALVARRAGREPLQHIIGTAPFRHLEIPVGPGVFVPRPETELLVDAVLPVLAAGGLAVDLCSGSGALALSLAHEVPGLRVIAVEGDDAALGWLKRNTAGTAVRVEHADVTCGPVLPEVAGRVDAVVCNPPYVPAGRAGDPEVAADPAAALFAGTDGLAVIRPVIERSGELLRPAGVLAMEHDDSHGEVVPALLRGDGRWERVTAHRDLAGRPRYVTARRR